MVLTPATGTRQEHRSVGSDEEPLRIAARPPVDRRPHTADDARQDEEGDASSQPRMGFRRIQEK